VRVFHLQIAASETLHDKVPHQSEVKIMHFPRLEN